MVNLMHSNLEEHQQIIFNTLMCRDNVPEEYAYLIARRCTNVEQVVNPPRTYTNKELEELRATGYCGQLFLWSLTPEFEEDSQWWSSFYDALCAEMKAKDGIL